MTNIENRVKNLGGERFLANASGKLSKRL